MDMTKKALSIAAAMFAVAVIANIASAQVGSYVNGNQLFWNYTTDGGANQANAAMYISPVPVPPNVGHTYYTYQPLYPHEMMFRHTDRFHNYYDDTRGLNRTKIRYYAPPVHTAASSLRKMFQLPRP